MSTTIIERIKKEIESLDTTAVPEAVGVVQSVGDGIAEIEGLAKAQMMEMVVFDVAGTTLRDDGDVVASRMAEALDMSPEALAAQTTDNFDRLFAKAAAWPGTDASGNGGVAA